MTGCRVRLSFVVGALCAACVFVVGALALAITITASERAVRDLSDHYARAAATSAQFEVQRFFDLPVMHLRTVAKRVLIHPHQLPSVTVVQASSAGAPPTAAQEEAQEDLPELAASTSLTADDARRPGRTPAAVLRRQQQIEQRPLQQPRTPSRTPAALRRFGDESFDTSASLRVYPRATLGAGGAAQAYDDNDDGLSTSGISDATQRFT